MSAERANMFIKAGKIFIDDVSVGNFKDMTINYAVTYADAKPGTEPNKIAKDIIMEEVTCEGTLCDLEIKRLGAILGVTTSVTGLTATTTLRIWEDTSLGSSISNVLTLAETAVSTTNVKIFTSDNQTELTKGTDYTLTTTAATPTKVWPKSSSMRNKAVVIEYDYADQSALRINIGGQYDRESHKLKFVYQDESTGKHFQVTILKAYATGGLNFTIPEEDYATIPVSFEGVADMTKARGQRLLTIVKER